MNELPQLILCKQLFSEAENFIQKDSLCSYGLAVSITQDAIELFLRSALKHRGIDTVKDKAGFSDTVSELSKDLVAKRDVPLPFKTKLEEINKARINFKHYGLSPNKVDAVRLLDYGETFLIDATKNIFNIDFASMSLISLISNQKIKTLLEKSNEYLKNCDFENSLCLSAQAVVFAINDMEKALPQMNRLNLGWDLPSEARKVSGVREIADSLGRTLTKAFDSLKEIAILTGLTIDLLAYEKFKKMTPVVFQLIGGNVKFQFTQFHERSNKPEDVKFCTDFAINFALAVQNKLIRQ